MLPVSKSISASASGQRISDATSLAKSMMKAKGSYLTFAAASLSLPLAVASFAFAFEKGALIFRAADELVSRIANVVAL